VARQRAAKTPLRFRLTPEPDPLRDLPGAKPRGRMLSPLPLSRWRAGRFARRIRKSQIPELFTYHEAVETDLYHHPFRTAFRLWPRLLWRILTNTRGKGTALVTGLLRGCLDAGVQVELEARAVELMRDETGAITGAIVEQRGMKQVTDTGAIEAAVDAVIAANPDKVEQAKAKPTMIGWFVGQVMKQSGGKANPQAVNDILKAKLGIE
jgi:hypothetical protein